MDLALAAQQYTNCGGMLFYIKSKTPVEQIRAAIPHGLVTVSAKCKVAREPQDNSARWVEWRPTFAETRTNVRFSAPHWRLRCC